MCNESSDAGSLNETAARERALREKIRVLLNTPIANTGSSSTAGTSLESGKTIRKKMTILGMVQESLSSIG